jgi:uncharacterized membrane protein YvbJ
MAEQFCKKCGKKLGFFNKTDDSKELCIDCFNEENLAKLDNSQQPENPDNRLLKLMLAIIFAIIIGGLALLWIITTFFRFGLIFSGSLVVPFFQF